jgi:hypothetical protein
LEPSGAMTTGWMGSRCVLNSRAMKHRAPVSPREEPNASFGYGEACSQRYP